MDGILILSPICLYLHVSILLCTIAHYHRGTIMRLDDLTFIRSSHESWLTINLLYYWIINSNKNGAHIKSCVIRSCVYGMMALFCLRFPLHMEILRNEKREKVHKHNTKTQIIHNRLIVKFYGMNDIYNIHPHWAVSLPFYDTLDDPNTHTHTQIAVSGTAFPWRKRDTHYTQHMQMQAMMYVSKNNSTYRSFRIIFCELLSYIRTDSTCALCTVQFVRCADPYATWTHCCTNMAICRAVQQIGSSSQRWKYVEESPMLCRTTNSIVHRPLVKSAPFGLWMMIHLNGMAETIHLHYTIVIVLSCHGIYLIDFRQIIKTLFDDWIGCTPYGRPQSAKWKKCLSTLSHYGFDLLITCSE